MPIYDGLIKDRLSIKIDKFTAHFFIFFKQLAQNKANTILASLHEWNSIHGTAALDLFCMMLHHALHQITSD